MWVRGNLKEIQSPGIGGHMKGLPTTILLYSYVLCIEITFIVFHKVLLLNLLFCTMEGWDGCIMRLLLLFLSAHYSERHAFLSGCQCNSVPPLQKTNQEPRIFALFHLESK